MTAETTDEFCCCRLALLSLKIVHPHNHLIPTCAGCLRVPCVALDIRPGTARSALSLHNQSCDA